MKRLLLFDVDGTLVYSLRRDSQAFAKLFKERYGHDFPSIDWEHYPHVSDTTIFGHAYYECIGKWPSQEERNVFKLEFIKALKVNRQRTPEHFNEIPGASQLIANLIQKKEFDVAIATGGWEGPARVKLNHVNIQFDSKVLVGADGKPTREKILGEAIEKAKRVNPLLKDVVYIGDAIWDVRTTRNMNLPLVGIRHKGDADYLHNAGVTTVIRNYIDEDAFYAAVENARPPEKK